MILITIMMNQNHDIYNAHPYEECTIPRSSSCNKWRRLAISGPLNEPPMIIIDDKIDKKAEVIEINGAGLPETVFRVGHLSSS